MWISTQQFNYCSYIQHSSSTIKKWEHNEAMHQLFTDFKKTYDSVRREVLYNIPSEFGIPITPTTLIKMCLNESRSRVWVGKHLPNMFPIKNGMKQGDTLTQLLFNFALQYAIRKVRAKQKGFKLNSTHSDLFCADDVNILDGSTYTVKKNTKALVVASEEIGLSVNAEKTKYMLMFGDQGAGENHNIKMDNKPSERAEEFTFWERK